MKKIFVTTLLIAGVLGFTHGAKADDSKEMMIGITDAYVPGGFDSNSDSFVVTSGIYPNSCYSYSRAQVTNTNDTTHEVRTFAKVQSGMCLMVLIPFHKEVRLGKLSAGKHTIRFVNGDGTFMEKSMTIE